MSILATLGSARAIFTASNGRDKVTCWDNRLHTSSRIDPLTPYPMWYRVRPRAWSPLGNSLLIAGWRRFCSGFFWISLFLETNLWTPLLNTSGGIVTVFQSSTTTMPCGQWTCKCPSPSQTGAWCCSTIQPSSVSFAWVSLIGRGKITISTKPHRLWDTWPCCQVVSSKECWKPRIRSSFFLFWF